ncbi:transcriptional regulator ArgP [Hahella sp. CCB-MM4]|uniref:LysR family transcriptional regulator ArgP n=1 Tax=Hahella sp. (strain CCB-MM4) TaxID=1926491 RepID=UPI000B9B2874|nr:LysR family transcriptional regulator ArgP [Hahella sp. CCB-MM4]OZG70727.1 transcriptional regulator ArgP [Hahella sp. CCB-MM4]
MTLDIRQLQALASVIDEGSFEKAARRLSLTQSAISQRIRQLEKSLGKILVIRESPARLTDDGLRLMKYYRQIDHLQTEMITQFNMQETTPRPLAIGTNADSLATWLLEALSPMLEESQWRMDIRVDDQDRTHELLHNGEVIGCISSSSSTISGCNCFHLGTMVYRCLVAPSYIERYFPDGITKQSIQQAPYAEYNFKDDLQKLYLQKYHQIEPVHPPHRIPSTESFLEFICRGHAWGMVPDVQSKNLQLSGAVVELIPDCPLDIELYWHIWDLKSSMSQKLTDAIIQQAQKSLVNSTSSETFCADL